MKKLVLAFAVLMTCRPLWSQQAGQFGGGLILGSPLGVTGKYWLDNARALDFGLGETDGDVAVWGDLLFHGWNILPKPSKGKLGLYFSVGGRMQNEEDFEFGLRTLGGVDYWIEGEPIELFAEMGPVFEFGESNASEVDIDGGLGVRFYIGGTTVAKK